MIRVLIVDGAVSRRQHLRELLASDPSITVIGEAARASEAKNAAIRLKPSVILIADRLPGGGGLEATAEIMVDAPIPIVIVSESHDASNVAAAMNALHVGALTILAIPGSASSPETRRFVSTIKAMAQVRVVRRWREDSRTALRIAAPRREGDQPSLLRVPAAWPIRTVAIGASTGGPAALQRLLGDLPHGFAPSILIVQHIAKGFLEGLIQWLASNCPLPVKIAENGEPLRASTVYVAPDDRHLGLADASRVLLDDGPAIGGFRPSASFLFESTAKALGQASVHVIMTGMGRDGVSGLEIAHASGATVIAQDEASSIVFGMPGAAISAGIVDRVIALEDIGQELTRIGSRR
ncbi:MAG TPA: chemotaxis protein CheB [Magnetospirillaceae bacterium]|jgi:two-component system chemotaxis response regulator CheB